MLQALFKTCKMCVVARLHCDRCTDFTFFFCLFCFKPQVSRALSEEDDVYSVLPKLMESQKGCAVDEGYSDIPLPNHVLINILHFQ